MIARICVYIVISAVSVWVSYILKSNFLSTFLSENIVIIIITLLAINTATYGFIVSKIDDMSKNTDEDFFEIAIKEVKKSLKLQIFLIAGSILVSILSSSIVISEYLLYSQEIFDFLLVFIFVFALDLLRDTGYAIFELRTPRNNGNEG